MANRKQFYFRQRVTAEELNAAFDGMEAADWAIAADLGFVGVVANAVVSSHAPVPDLTVDVSGPGMGIDPRGRRLFFSALQNVSIGVDDNGVATTVSGDGKERIVSIYLSFDRSGSDPRIDGNTRSVNFQEDESFKLSVAQGAEAASGAAVPPGLRQEGILLADVTRRYGQTQVLADDISTLRRQDAFALQGSPRSLRRGRTLDVLGDLLSFYNAHVSGLADRHGAAAIDFAGASAWRDETANPATSVQAQLEKVISDLSSDTGADRIGASASGGLPAGSIRKQLAMLDAAAARTDAVNTFSQVQILNGVAADTTPAIRTNVIPRTRKLLWEIATGSVFIRFYAVSGAAEFVLNARWDGNQWVRDSPSSNATMLEFAVSGLRFVTYAGSGATFPDGSWTGDWRVLESTSVKQSLDAGGNWTSPGPTTTYVGAYGATGPIGSGASFRKVFPATPSSFTFNFMTWMNIQAPPVVIGAHTAGFGAYAEPVKPGMTAYFFYYVTVS